MGQNNLEIKRQIFHAILGIIVAILYYYNILNIKIIGLVIIIGIITSFIQSKKELPIITQLIKNFERPNVLFPGYGAITYAIGIFLIMLLFEEINRNIVIASILILALGDSTSHIIGVRYGKRQIKILSQKKMIEGTAAGIILATIGAMFFVPLWQAFIASFVAMTIELIELENKIDDNITVPLSAAAVLYIIMLI